MSASREKKIRQDLAAQGVTDPKKIREAEEKAKARKNNILYGVIAGVFVIVAAVLLVYNSGVLQRSATAVTINGEKIMPKTVSGKYRFNKSYTKVPAGTIYEIVAYNADGVASETYTATAQ